MDVKEFLQRDEIQKLLAQEDLKEVYWQYEKDLYTKSDVSHLTEFFLSIGINPLDYMTEVLPRMFVMTDITSIEIPSHITEIGDYAFSLCENLTNIYLPDTINRIGNKAFAFCHRLANIQIPEKVTKILPNTFDSCFNLSTITVVGQYTKLPEDTFFTSNDYTLRCYEDSAAHIFAEDNRINYKLIE